MPLTWLAAAVVGAVVGAWLLAAVAAAALIPSAQRVLPAGWRRVYTGALVLLSAAAVSTKATNSTPSRDNSRRFTSSPPP